MRRLLPFVVCISCSHSCNQPAGTDAQVDAAKDAAPPVDAVSDAPADTGPADDAMPPASSPDLTTRGRHLLEAIAQDNPDLASDILFPRDAWANARDGQDPTKQWDEKIKPAFQAAVHYWHKHTKDVARAQFVSFEIGKTVQQITPKKKEWKKTLWEAKHGKLSFSIDGQSKHIEIIELVSWRGAWYVTHLR